MNDKPTETVPVALDGGWGWAVLLGAFLAYFIADGWSYSFGVFYQDIIEHFDEGKGKTALIGALLYGVPMLLSPVVCALTSCYGCRPVCMIGGLLLGISFVISAFATSVNFLCVSIGLFASIGLAMTYVTALFSVTFYFEKRRAFATGLAVTGSGLGAFVFPPLMDYTEEIFAWRGMLLLFGGVCFNVIIAGALFRPPPAMTVDKYLEKEDGHQPSHASEPDQSESCTFRLVEHGEDIVPETHGEIATEQMAPEIRSHTQEATGKCCSKFTSELQTLVKSMFDRSLAYSWSYLLYAAANFVLFLWAGVPYVYLVNFVIENGQNPSHASFLLSIIAIGRTVGQILLGFLGDQPKIDQHLLYAGAVTVSGVATVLVPFCAIYATLALYAFIFGFCISVTYTLPMVCLVRLVGLTRAASAFGLLQLAQGIATLLGTPIAGWLYDRTSTYVPSFYIAGAWITFSGLAMLPLVFAPKPTEIQCKKSEESQETSVI